MTLVVYILEHQQKRYRRLLLCLVCLQFGRLMRYLESSKLADNTYIMISGDNGKGDARLLACIVHAFAAL
jgi:hypothetical protein